MATRASISADEALPRLSRKFSLGASIAAAGILAASTTISSAKKSGKTTKRLGPSTVPDATEGAMPNQQFGD
jgi:anti-sigma factor RsiW